MHAHSFRAEIVIRKRFMISNKKRKEDYLVAFQTIYTNAEFVQLLLLF